MEMDHNTDDWLAAAEGFAALGSEQRLRVLHMLVRAGDAGLPVGDLGARSGITGSTLTHHLKMLAAAGLVRQVREGRRIICVAEIGRLEALSTCILAQCCADQTGDN